MFRLRVTALAVLLSLVHQPAFSDPADSLRISHQRLAQAFADGQRRSATFRQLVARLEASDLIVHAEPSPPGYPVDGALQFVGATESRRYLRITLRIDLTDAALVALFGHELMHAVEVARHPAVRDEAGFRGLYEAIGERRDNRLGIAYDTRAAIVAGLRVARELQLASGGSPRAPGR